MALPALEAGTRSSVVKIHVHRMPREAVPEEASWTGHGLKAENRGLFCAKAPFCVLKVKDYLLLKTSTGNPRRPLTVGLTAWEEKQRDQRTGDLALRRHEG